MVMDTFGCTPTFLKANPKAAKAMVDSYFEAVEMIQKDPKKSLRDHGRGREAVGRPVRSRRATCAGRTRRRTRNSSPASMRSSATRRRTFCSSSASSSRCRTSRRSSTRSSSSRLSRPATRRGGWAPLRVDTFKRRSAPRARSALRRIAFFVVFVAGWSARDVRRLRVADLPRRPADHAAGRLRAVRAARLHQGHRRHGMARAGRLRAGSAVRRAAGNRDGRVQADRGVLRALRVVRALPARRRRSFRC